MGVPLSLCRRAHSLMATGYDNRQPTRQSFAFQPATPAPVQAPSSGQSRGAEVVGGQSQGGVVTTTPQTSAGPIGGQLGQFVEAFMRPHVERRQREEFFKGFTNGMEGEAIKEAAKEDTGLSKIFGPSGYHRGAADYASLQKIDEFNTYLNKNAGELAKLSRDDRAKMLADKFVELKTGDLITDQLLQQRFMETSAPTLNTLSKAAYAYDQDQAAKAYSGAGGSAAENLRAVAEAQTALGSKADTSAIEQAASNYVALLAQPHGMDTETWRKSVGSHINNVLAGGNFFAYQALQRAGYLKSGGPLSDDDLAKLESKYQSAAHRAQAQIAFDPSVNKLTSMLNSEIQFGQIKSPAEIKVKVDTINDYVARRTGITDSPFITADDLAGMQRSFDSNTFQAGLRLQSRQWQLEDRKVEWQHQEDMKDREMAQKLKVAAVSAANGNLATDMATGLVAPDDANAVMLNALTRGDYKTLADNYRGGEVNSAAAASLQTGFDNSAGQGGTVGFKHSMERWAGLYKVNPAAAAAYAGKYAAQAEGYANARAAGEPEIAAYTKTFGRPPSTGRASLPDGVNEKDATSSAKAAITADDRWGFGMLGNRTPLAKSSLNYLTAAVRAKAAEYTNSSGVSFDTAAKRVYSNMMASGEWERYGPIAWPNPGAGHRKLSAYLGLPDDATDQLVTSVLDKSLKTHGYAKGASGSDMFAVMAPDARGRPNVYVQALDGGVPTDIVMTFDQLRAANRKQILTPKTKPTAYKAGGRLGGMISVDAR